MRDSMESSIVVLRDRGLRGLKRVQMMALIGAVVLGIVILRRINRPPTTRERIERVVPLGWWDRLRAGYAKQVPPMRLYVGDRQVGEEPRRAAWEGSAARVARTLGTALGSALASQGVSLLMRRLQGRDGAAAGGADSRQQSQR